ncbi:LysR family transcriptional regulator [Magnetospirillum sp. 64-120]|uniref:LysR substrate-binding domain-containing protein n=1 Tax=Magnetospirillum sp. 64-120 TaxID=1895778 RepID=UPI00092B3061|nr:LysR family transcriptional regulator [Magnetospirillum sp. 64-120]OJX78588.1 MAG: LysR family transcriptional regulator [Magnetospirillum sp. 64-120]
MFDLRDMKWAVVASAHRSFRKAAETLRVRQPTLSRRLRTLEYRLGIKLFERTNGGSWPTADGREFLDAARHILEEIDSIAIRFKGRSGREGGRLSIGVQSPASAGNLRATLIEHRRRFPEVTTGLVDGSSEQLISYLASSVVDVAFLVEGAAKCEGKSLPVWGERVVAAIPEDHPLRDHEVIHWSDLECETLLLPRRGVGPEFLKLLSSRMGGSDSCDLFHHDVAIDGLLTLVGAGWGILLALEGVTGAVYPGVVFREVYDAQAPARLNFRACWRPSNGNPALGPFLEMLGERYPDLAADSGPG